MYFFRWTIGWDDKSFGCYVLLAKLTGKAIYKIDAERNLDYWTTGSGGNRVQYTPGGLAFLDHFSTLGYASSAAFLALYYHDLATTSAKDLAYYNFAVQQINYMLGANPGNHSYVVGFGVNPPQNPHHRTAHGAWMNNLLNSPVNSRHLLYGALVSGPGMQDEYVDSRLDFQRNEVTTTMNALFSGALAKLVQDFGGSPLANFPEIETPFDEYLVDANFNATGPNFSEFSVGANNHTAWPARIPREVKFRLFIDITEGLAAGFSAANYTVSSIDKTVDGRVITSPVTFTQLLPWAADSNIYYTEVSFIFDTAPDLSTHLWPGGP